jgi:ClpX C4-type zinc finger/Clp amino terminal domain, pathogenicity island component
MDHGPGPAHVDVHALTTAVEHVTGSPLDRIEAALSLGNELTIGADELIGHFVAGARKAGCSWTEIGERIGVSKQAARQRFTPLPAAPPGALPVRQARLVACLDAAGRAAVSDGSAEIGTHHQLIGLFKEGAAAAIMESLGLTAAQVREAAGELFPGGGRPGGLPADLPPPESAGARAALIGAARLAQRAGIDMVGTEQLLGALALDPGSHARRVLNKLGASIPAIKKELECYIGPSRARRRGKKVDQRCSFCGKGPDGGVRMVAGPSVWICSECVSLASEIIAEDGGAGPG